MIPLTTVFIVLYVAISLVFILMPRTGVSKIIKRDMDGDFGSRKLGNIAFFRMMLFCAAIAAGLLTFIVKLVLY